MKERERNVAPRQVVRPRDLQSGPVVVDGERFVFVILQLIFFVERP